MLKEQVIKETTTIAKGERSKCKGGIAPLCLQPLLLACRRRFPADVPAMLQRVPTAIKQMKTKNLSAHRYEEKKEEPCARHSYPTTSTNQLSSGTGQKKEKRNEIILLPQLHLPQSRQREEASYFCTVGELRLTLHIIARPAPSNALTYALFLCFFWLYSWSHQSATSSTRLTSLTWGPARSSSTGMRSKSSLS